VGLNRRGVFWRFLCRHSSRWLRGHVAAVPQNTRRRKKRTNGQASVAVKPGFHSEGLDGPSPNQCRSGDCSHQCCCNPSLGFLGRADPSRSSAGRGTEVTPNSPDHPWRIPTAVFIGRLSCGISLRKRWLAAMVVAIAAVMFVLSLRSCVSFSRVDGA
jgi:hypothetical protein